MIQDCHNHMQKVWIKAVVSWLSVHISNVLADDLIHFDWCLIVMTMFDRILRVADKEFSLPANYPKGHGDMFKNLLPKYHFGALLVPAGWCQDLATKEASAIYWNRIYYVEFLDESLQGTKDYILQKNLFVVLTLMEMVALSHVLSSSFQSLHVLEMACW